MRTYLVLMASGLLLMLMLGLQLSISLVTAVAIEADVNIHPEVFNLKRNGTGAHGVITAQISNLMKESVSYVKDIDVSTIMLYHKTTFVAQPLRVEVAEDKLIVKFDATTVANYIWFKLCHMGIVPPTPPPDYAMTFTIKGELFSGAEFAGSDTIKIMLP